MFERLCEARVAMASHYWPRCGGCSVPAFARSERREPIGLLRVDLPVGLASGFPKCLRPMVPEMGRHAEVAWNLTIEELGRNLLPHEKSSG
jgi:hypothetical protein